MANEKIQILAWKADGKLYGVPIELCKEVNKDILVTPVPHAKESIAGIVNLRGDIVTVLDLGVLLGYSREEKRDYYTIVRLKSDIESIAIKADTVEDILEVDNSAFQSAGQHLGEEEAKYINKVALTERGLVLMVDSHNLFRQH